MTGYEHITRLSDAMARAAAAARAATDSMLALSPLLLALKRQWYASRVRQWQRRNARRTRRR